MSKRRLFAELFTEYVIQDADKRALLEEKHQFYTAALFWKRWHQNEHPEDLALQAKNEAIYVFAKLEFYREAFTHVLAPSFGAALLDVQFDGISILPSFESTVGSYCIEFPDSVRFSDDEDSVFWKSAIFTIYVDEEKDQITVTLLIPDYNAEDQLTGSFTVMDYELDSFQDAGTIIEKFVESYKGDYISPQVIEYALKALFYIVSVNSDLKKEKGFHYIDTKNINPLKKPNRTVYTTIQVGTNLEPRVKGKRNPDWHWIRDVDKGVPGFKLELLS